MKPVNKIVHAFLLVLLPGLISVGADYYYGIPENALIRNTVMLGIGTMCLVFSWLRCGEDGTLDDHNTLHPARFVLCYTAGICLGSLLPFFPVQAWPLVPFALALSLSSNLFLGIFAYGTVVMHAVFLTESTLLVWRRGYFTVPASGERLSARHSPDRYTAVSVYGTDGRRNTVW